MKEIESQRSDPLERIDIEICEMKGCYDGVVLFYIASQHKNEFHMNRATLCPVGCRDDT